MTTSPAPDAPDAPDAADAPGPAYVARSTTDLVALAPLVLGFHPRDSVVLLTFGSGDGSRPGFHARIDLPTDLDEQQDVVVALVGPCRLNGVRRAAVLLHTDDAESARSQAELLLEGLHAADVEVIDVVRVEDDRWFPVPEDGDPGTAYDLTTHPFTARHVFEGHAVRRDRDELVASLVGRDDADLVAVTLAATRTTDDLLLDGRPVRAVLRPEGRWVQRRVRQFVHDRQPLTASDAGRLLALVGVVETRDVAWAEIDRPTAARHVDLWQGLVRRCPEDLLPGACGLLAFAAWQAGDGALAWCALDRCAEVDPDYSMAERVAQALLSAVPPDTWRPVAEHELALFAGVSARRGRAGRD